MCVTWLQIEGSNWYSKPTLLIKALIIPLSRPRQLEALQCPLGDCCSLSKTFTAIPVSLNFSHWYTLSREDDQYLWTNTKTAGNCFAYKRILNLNALILLSVGVVNVNWLSNTGTIAHKGEEEFNVGSGDVTSLCWRNSRWKSYSNKDSSTTTSTNSTKTPQTTDRKPQKSSKSWAEISLLVVGRAFLCEVRASEGCKQARAGQEQWASSVRGESVHG